MPARRVQLSRIGVLAGSVALLIGLTACSAGGNHAAAPRTATVTRGDVTAGVTANGSFAAMTSENLGFATGGKLTSVKVKVGDHVEAGQVLAKIDFDHIHALISGEVRTVLVEIAGLPDGE